MLFQTGVLLLYTFPALSQAYSDKVKPYSHPIVIPLTQVHIYCFNNVSSLIFASPLSQVALTGSVYSVVIVAMERYFNICKPFHKNLVERVTKC